jgi:hypothetical protein
MYTYFTVTCHFHDQSGDERNIHTITDGTMTGDIPIEMIREYNDPRTTDGYMTRGARMNLQYTFQEFCDPDNQLCKPCKETYEGPASGAAGITRAPSGGASDWMATFSLGGPEDYNIWCSDFDPKGNYCPPRYPSYSKTGEPRIAIPLALSTCGTPQDLLIMSIGAVSCDITDSPFVLRDGEVITYKSKNQINDYSYESADATYAFHISAK